MTGFLRKHGATLAVVGLVAAFGALALCRGSTGCFLSPGGDRSAEQAVDVRSETQPQNPLGEKQMATAPTQGKLEHANEATFDRQVLQADVPVLVDFYADWCGPCQMIAPVLEEVARETPGGKVVKVNVDDNPGLASRYRISSIPSLLVFKDGEVVSQHVGLANKAQLKALLGG